MRIFCTHAGFACCRAAKLRERGCIYIPAAAAAAAVFLFAVVAAGKRENGEDFARLGINEFPRGPFVPLGYTRESFVRAQKSRVVCCSGFFSLCTPFCPAIRARFCPFGARAQNL